MGDKAQQEEAPHDDVPSLSYHMQGGTSGSFSSDLHIWEQVLENQREI